jgi:hypothetical protein
VRIIGARRLDDSGIVILRAAYSPSGHEIVGCGGPIDQQGSVAIWNAADLKWYREPNRHAPTASASQSPDGTPTATH